MSYPPRKKYTDFHFEAMTVVELEQVIKEINEFDRQIHVHQNGIDWLNKYTRMTIKANWWAEGYHLYSPFDPARIPSNRP